MTTMTTMNGIFKWFYDLGNWLAKVMYLHFLWIIFTVLGLGIFGISPATAGLFSVLHKWFDDDFDIPIFQHFYSVYKTQFFKANGLGLIIMGLGAFLYIDMNVSKDMIESFPLHLLLLFVTFLYSITTIYLFPVFVRYNLTFFLYFKQAFFVALARPLETIAIAISMLLLFYLFSYLPVLLFFIGASIIALPIMWFAYRACVQIEEKKAS